MHNQKRDDRHNTHIHFSNLASVDIQLQFQPNEYNENDKIMFSFFALSYSFVDFFFAVTTSFQNLINFITLESYSEFKT